MWAAAGRRQAYPAPSKTRFNFHSATLLQQVPPGAAPQPVLRSRAQSLFHRIEVEVVELLPELVLAEDVEFMVALQPEGSDFPAVPDIRQQREHCRVVLLEVDEEVMGGKALPGFHHLRESAVVIEPEGGVDMVGHDDETGNMRPVPPGEVAQHGNHDLAHGGSGEEGPAAGAAKGDEMAVAKSGKDALNNHWYQDRMVSGVGQVGLLEEAQACLRPPT